MKKILHITSSLNNQGSFSNKLSQAIIDKLSNDFPHSTVMKRDLMESTVPHLSAAEFEAFRVLPENRTQQQTSAVKISDDFIDELLDSDIIVIGVPLYNFGIPSVLKAWLDHIIRSGITFKYTEQGVQGLLQNKKVYLAISSGGVYSDGPMKNYDFTEPYLKAALGFIGLTDITTLRIEGIAIPDLAEAQIEKSMAAVNSL
jgi:FMN-dependent NADH-azoreductase